MTRAPVAIATSDYLMQDLGPRPKGQITVGLGGNQKDELPGGRR